MAVDSSPWSKKINKGKRLIRNDSRMYVIILVNNHFFDFTRLINSGIINNNNETEKEEVKING